MEKLNSFNLVKNIAAARKDANEQALILPIYFTSQEKPIIESSIDRRIDRQVKKDISTGISNQENIRILFQSPDRLSGILRNTSLYPEQMKTIVDIDKKRLLKMKFVLSPHKRQIFPNNSVCII